MAAVSHCEPMEARRIVPCFDEPKYKAVWNVTIIHPNGTKAIANAMELSETTEPNGKWKVSRFRPTPILASYLVALFVSEFDYDETYTNRGVRDVTMKQGQLQQVFYCILTQPELSTTGVKIHQQTYSLYNR
ncbi:hypothetical protein ANCCEY_04997 [Ancylostoma ceylanicum]|uniref:Aminopeptidase N-like N-terminal domain-containing protein n=1 Tax=Ancylostoma ceylanicum TaxID=53326 RepID=A0A0D6M7Q1_9BILA|nr:hypothetical protein ANCCEY_04997 [Ancylostoma ceylanicum]